MGRIKTQLIKRITHKFIAKYKAHLNSDFEHNKVVAEKYISNKSKKIRNTIAGYATRIMKRNQGG